MTCREFVEFLMAYLGGGLSPADRAAFEEHLAECPDCVNYLHTYQQTIRLSKAVCCRPDDSLPEGVPERLIRAILAARGR